MSDADATLSRHESATETLRVLLDERGVEHYDGTECTLWLKDEQGYRASADELSDGRISLHLWCTTPQQAVDATLGRGECHDTSKYVNHFTCSVCGEEMDFITEHGGPHYCPYCGRRVIGGDA